MKHLLLLFLTAFSLSLSAQQPEMTIGKLTMDDMGINKIFYRWDPDGNLIVDNAGMALEMSLTFNAKNLAGKRLFCLLYACDKNWNVYADRVGQCATMGAINLNSSNVNGTFHVVMPQPWLTTGGGPGENGGLNIAAQIFTMDDDLPSVYKELVLTGDDVKINNRNLPNKLLSDIFSGGSGGGSDSLSSLIGGLLGGSSMSSTQPCPTCDGTRLCQSCDGDGYFNPADCRKCSAMPGVCRRCKGEGEVTITVDYHDSLF